MAFDPVSYGPEVARILALDGDGLRPMPLVIQAPGPNEAREALRGCTAKSLFAGAPCPDGALAGLWLYFGFFDEAHQIAQEIHTADGSYWHAIVHRQEPDPGNAGYWFRRAGQHPIFAPLLDRAREILAGRDIGFRPGVSWDPFAFINFCERARRRPGSEEEDAGRAIQQAEWQLLFTWCAAPLESARPSWTSHSQ